MSGAGAVLALFLVEWAAGWAGAAAWTQGWGVVRRGHFRISAWCVVAIAVAAVPAYSAATDEGGITEALVLALAGLSVLYLVAQYAASDRVAALVGFATGGVGVAALLSMASLLDGWGQAVAGVGLITGAVSFGSITNGMMLGHWYLNQPGLKPWALARLTDLALVGVGLSAAFGLATAGPLTSARTEGAVLGLPGFGLDFGMWFYVTWIVLVASTGGVVWMARRCVSIRSIQSATGLFYVAILTSGVAEFLVRYLMVNAA